MDFADLDICGRGGPGTVVTLVEAQMVCHYTISGLTFRNDVADVVGLVNTQISDSASAAAQGAAADENPAAGGRRAATPLYHQIYLVLRDGIVNGTYALGAVLPGEQALTERYGVSRITAKRALNELAAEGLVQRERGRGTRVCYDASSAPLEASVEGLYQNLVRMGRDTEVSVVSFGYVPAPPDVARALGCASGDTVQRVQRVRRVDGQPFSFLTTHVPEDIGRSFGEDDLAQAPLITLLERCGIRVSAAAQTMSAALADSVTAPLLDVDVGSALLMISRTVLDQRDRPVEHLVGLYRPDRYQYNIDLRRVDGADAARWAPQAPGPAGQD